MRKSICKSFAPLGMTPLKGVQLESQRAIPRRQSIKMSDALYLSL